MATNQILVGPQTNPDYSNVPVTARGGRSGETVVTQLHGKYYEQASRGNIYVGSSASTGIALLVPATTGGHPTLWNPLGSGVNLSIVRLSLSYVSGNNAPGAIEWAYTASAGAQTATGAPIATATRVAPTSALLGGPVNNKGIWSPTTNTFSSAPTFFRTSGISLFTGVAATAVAPFAMFVDYDGSFCVAPGNAVSLCFQASTTTALFQVSVIWEEIPT